MSEFRITFTVEVDQVGNGLAIRTPVVVQLIRQGRQWQAVCESLRFETEPFDAMEEALIAAGDQAAAEIQAAVNERPFIAGRITPDNIPVGIF